MSFKNTPFYVGGYYRDREQGYEVIEIASNGMKVKYDDGTVKTIGIESVAIKARIYENILAEFKHTLINSFIPKNRKKFLRI